MHSIRIEMSYIQFRKRPKNVKEARQIDSYINQIIKLEKYGNINQKN